MAADHPEPNARSIAARSGVSKGLARFLEADGRSAGARRLKAREAALAEPLGGLAGLTPAERLRVQSAAALAMRLEIVRSSIARGEVTITDEDLIRLSNGLARELAALDKLATARRKAKPGSPLADYLAEKARAEAAA